MAKKHKDVFIDKGRRLVHGYKTTKAERISHGESKDVKVATGKRLVHGYETTKGADKNRYYKDGGNAKDDKYIVNVGNIGNIRCGSMEDAEKTYSKYVSQSESGYGRAGGEYVGLMVDGEPTKEHFGSNMDMDEEYAKGGDVESKKTWLDGIEYLFNL